MGDGVEFLSVPGDGRVQKLLRDIYDVSIVNLSRKYLKRWDLSCVELLKFTNDIGISLTLILKTVAPPWDREVDIYVETFPRLIKFMPDLIMTFRDDETQNLSFFLENISGVLLRDSLSPESVERAAESLATIHFKSRGILNRLERRKVPSLASREDYEAWFDRLVGDLANIGLLSSEGSARPLRERLDDALENILGLPITLVHGDLYADNIIITAEDVKFIDWGSAFIGGGFLDVVSLTSPDERKNGDIRPFRENIIRAYVRTYRDLGGENLSRFNLERTIASGEWVRSLRDLSWLVERIKGGFVTPGPIREWAEEGLRKLVSS
ncbi:MAG: phosphotransferase family protein [bacterium]